MYRQREKDLWWIVDPIEGIYGKKLDENLFEFRKYVDQGDNTAELVIEKVNLNEYSMSFMWTLINKSPLEQEYFNVMSDVDAKWIEAEIIFNHLIENL